jgi:hypothetical protein
MEGRVSEGRGFWVRGGKEGCGGSSDMLEWVVVGARAIVMIGMPAWSFVNG